MKLTLPRFAVLLAVVLSVWFRPSVFGGKVLLPVDLLWQHRPHTPPDGVEGVHNALLGDMLYENFAWKTVFREAIAEGELPLWNPHSFAGHPLYATGQASTFYPLNLIFLLVPLPQAYLVFTILHLWLGGVFQYLFLRRIGIGAFGATLGGLVFAMCGFFAMRLVWPMLLGSAIWLPLMLLCIVWLSESESFRQAAVRVAAGAILFAMPLLSGFFEIAFYAYVAAGLFTLARCWNLAASGKSFARVAGLCGQALAVVLLALMLAGLQLLPFLEVIRHNTRMGESDYDKIVERALQPAELLPVIIPDVFGNPAKHTTWDLRRRTFVPITTRYGQDHYHFGARNYSENGYYLGLLPLALAVVSLRVRGQHRWFFWLLLLVSVLMAFGTRAYALLFYVVPGFEQVRTPFRWMFPATFAVASLAAIGSQRWRQRLDSGSCSRAGRLTGIVLIVGPMVLLIVLLVMLAWPESAQRLAAGARERFEILSRGAVPADAWALAGMQWANAFRFAVYAAAAAAILALPLMRSWSRRGAIGVAMVCLAFVALDAGLANGPFSAHDDPAGLDRVPPSIRYLQNDKDDFRIARFGREVVFHPNLPTLYGLNDVGGYDSIILSNYARYLCEIEPQRSLWTNRIIGFVQDSSLDSPLLSLLNIRYMLTGTGDEGIEHADWELVYDDEIRIYRNRQERPRAFMVHQAIFVEQCDDAIALIRDAVVDTSQVAVVEGSPAQVARMPSAAPADPGTVEIIHSSHNRVDLATSSAGPGIVVLCDVMYPGWQAYVNDAPADILKVDGIFRGVSVPGGDHRVSLRFEPGTLRNGWILLCSGLAILVVAMGLGRLTPTRSVQAPTPAGATDRPEAASHNERP